MVAYTGLAVTMDAKRRFEGTTCSKVAGYVGLRGGRGEWEGVEGLVDVVPWTATPDVQQGLPRGSESKDEQEEVRKSIHGGKRTGRGRGGYGRAVVGGWEFDSN